ncbi:MAG: hypothetical protein DLM59_17865 [Pseudonocardiales bacterium]|nr:MAG: hypothetical protein DLM59_17865 [Pseudonocardiales bacterium]
MCPNDAPSQIDANKNLVRRMIDEVWNAGQPDRLPDFWDESTREETEQLHQFLTDAFPDIQIAVEDLVAEADRVAMRLTFRGTHQGSFRGIPPTGRQSQIRGDPHLPHRRRQGCPDLGHRRHIRTHQPAQTLTASSQTGSSLHHMTLTEARCAVPVRFPLRAAPRRAGPPFGSDQAQATASIGLVVAQGHAELPGGPAMGSLVRMTGSTSSPSREQLLDVELEGLAQVDRVVVVRVELAPGEIVARHRHPCPVVGWVLDGAICLGVADAPKRVVHAGEAFHEPANTVIAPVDNASDSGSASFVACYLLPPGEDRVIEMLDDSS